MEIGTRIYGRPVATRICSLVKRANSLIDLPRVLLDPYFIVHEVKRYLCIFLCVKVILNWALVQWEQVKRGNLDK